MKLEKTLTDETILAELGGRLAQRRLALGLTQAELAARAGIGKRTLEGLEAGGSAQMTTLIRVMRVLDLLGNLDQAVPEAGPGPLDVVQRRGKVRQRASSSRKQPKTGTWAWAEDA